jgi:hypothetical protein
VVKFAENIIIFFTINPHAPSKVITRDDMWNMDWQKTHIHQRMCNFETYTTVTSPPPYAKLFCIVIWYDKKKQSVYEDDLMFLSTFKLAFFGEYVFSVHRKSTRMKNNGGDSNGLPYFTVLCISLGGKNMKPIFMGNRIWRWKRINNQIVHLLMRNMW